MKNILDPSFRYTSSLNTDVKKTFARIRRSQHQASARATPVATSPVNIAAFVKKKAGATD